MHPRAFVVCARPAVGRRLPAVSGPEALWMDSRPAAIEHGTASVSGGGPIVLESAPAEGARAPIEGRGAWGSHAFAGGMGQVSPA